MALKTKINLSKNFYTHTVYGPFTVHYDETGDRYWCQYTQPDAKSAYVVEEMMIKYINEQCVHNIYEMAFDLELSSLLER